MEMILKLLYKAFPKQFNKIIASEQMKPIGFDKMEKIFVDSNGFQYYKVSNSMDLPIERKGKLNQFLMWLNMGLGTMIIEKKDGKEIQYLELDLILDAMEEALNQGLKTKGKAALIGSLINEIRERKNLVIHTELLYNLLAVQWIREDENPSVYDEEKQIEKVKQFKYEVSQSNSYFFFATTKLHELLPFLKITEQEWDEYWQLSIIKQKALQEYLKNYLPKEESEKQSKTSESN